MGTKARRAVWCLWFALLMGAPYILGHHGSWLARGPVSLSSVYAFIAVGVLAGAWLGIHPTVSRWLPERGRVADALLVVGSLATLLTLTVPSWVRVIFSYASNQSIVWRGPHAAAGTLMLSVSDGLSALLNAQPYLGLAAGFLCGLLFTVAFATPQTPIAFSRFSFAAMVPPLALGFLHPLAWMLAYPHSAFPQPLLGTTGAAEAWTRMPLALSLAPMAVMGVTLYVISRPREGEDEGDPSPFRVLSYASCLCLGMLLFRLASRIMPSLFATPLWLAVVSLVTYLLVLAAYLVMLPRRTVRNGHEMGQVGPSDGDETTREAPTEPNERSGGTSWLRSALAQEDASWLLAKGLSEKELLVVCAEERALTSDQASAIMGVSASTVREYRRRVRVKLNVPPAQPIHDMLPSARREAKGRVASPVAPDEERGPLPAQARPTLVPMTVKRKMSRAARVLAWVVCLAPALWLFLPVHAPLPAWQSAWTVPFGAGAGLFLAWLMSFAVAPGNHVANPPLRAITILGALSWAIGIIMSALLETGALELTAGHAPQKLVTMVSAALVASGTCLLLTRLSGGLQGAQSSSTGGRQPSLPAYTPLPWLLGCALIAWAWEETWRAQGFVTLLPAMALPTLALVALLLVKTYSAWRAASRADARLLSSLHSPLLALAFGCVAGALASNAYGQVLGRPGQVEAIGGMLGYRNLVMLVVGALGWAVVLACYLHEILAYMLHRSALHDLEPGERERVRAYLLSRGLTSQQIDGAVLLAEGLSVTQVSKRLNYSASSVHLIRRETYRKLRIHSRDQLTAVLQAVLRD